MEIGIWIALAVVAVIILRFMSETRVHMPEGSEHIEPDMESGKHSTASTYKIEPAWEGQLGEVPYTVECLDDETWTVSIECEELPKQLEVDARAGFPEKNWDEARDADIRALLKEGADYLDIGYYTEWVAASIPIKEARLDKARAERIVTHLINLRAASK